MTARSSMGVEILPVLACISISLLSIATILGYVCRFRCDQNGDDRRFASGMLVVVCNLKEWCCFASGVLSFGAVIIWRFSRCQFELGFFRKL